MIDDSELKARLSELEARVPVTAAPAPGRRRRMTPLLGGSLAAAVVLLVAATATIGAAVVTRTDVRGYPGVENPGQPLAGAKLECMTPPQAQAYLTAHGFTNVVWQIERDGSATAFASNPPARGYVIAGFIDDEGVLNMLVDQRASAQPFPSCSGSPTP